MKKQNYKSKLKRVKVAAKTKSLGFVSSYMVWVSGTASTSFRHCELGSAKIEAERLCRKENKPVYVLADVCKCEPLLPPVKWISAT